MNDYDYQSDQDLRNHWSEAERPDPVGAANRMFGGDLSEHHDETDHQNASHDDDVPSEDTESSAEESDTSTSSDLSIEQFTIPANLKTDAIYSERDVYRIVNALIVLESCDATMGRWIDLALGIKGQNIRRAMNLVKMDQSTFDDHIRCVSTLSTIRDVSLGITEGNAMDAAFNLIAQISDMSTEHKTVMISLVRRMNTDMGTQNKVRQAKNTPDVEIVKDLRESMVGENSIADQVVMLSEVISALSDAVR